MVAKMNIVGPVAWVKTFNRSVNKYLGIFFILYRFTDISFNLRISINSVCPYSPNTQRIFYMGVRNF